MKRSQILLSALGAVLVIALFYVVLYAPAREEAAAIEAEIVTEQEQQAALNQEIARLRSVREEAPEVEAELAAAEAIVPRDAALPSALRQLQLAADESGIVLQSVTTGRPIPVPEATDGLSSVDVNVQLLGGYFQVVDFMRRVEDPAITPRGLAWNSASISRADAYPDLNVAMTGALFATIPAPAPVEPEPETPVDPEAATDSDDPDADVDVDVDLEQDADAEDAP